MSVLIFYYLNVKQQYSINQSVLNILLFLQFLPFMIYFNVL